MWRLVAVIAAVLGLLLALAPASSADGGATQYSHIFVIVEENHSYNDIIGNKNARNFNSWASTYGLGTDYFGAIHPSEGNYVAMVGGNAYGIENDNIWSTNPVNQPNLVDQLEAAGLSWKGYFEDMPFAGYTGKFNDGELYASKHNGFLNFTDINTNPARLNHLVPYSNLTQDLGAGTVPNFSFIVPNQCDDMHGLPQCNNNQTNIAVADVWAGIAVGQIMNSSTWASGNNAIVVAWDEGKSNQGCCDANAGGGHVPFIVITNNGPRGVQDSTAANHYSLLATIQQAFGLGCTANFGGVQTPVGFTCDSQNVVPLTQLLLVGG
jgi:phosphatidylinositol-3-phosphatase